MVVIVREYLYCHGLTAVYANCFGSTVAHVYYSLLGTPVVDFYYHLFAVVAICDFEHCAKLEVFMGCREGILVECFAICCFSSLKSVVVECSFAVVLYYGVP